MQTNDFSRSFLTFRLDVEKKPPRTVSHCPPFRVNNARIQLECRLRLAERETGRLHTFVLGASCKTERVGVERDVWTEPNADFVPVFSDDAFLNIKTFARAGTEIELYPPGSGVQGERQTGSIAEAFDSVLVDVAESEGRPLESPPEVIEATLANLRLVARTEIESPRYGAILEYPVKTMNASERDGIYQVDTGPVLFPDLSRPPEGLLGGMELAFVAFNRPDWAEFILRVPTPVGGGVSVYHYSRTVRLETRNLVVALEPTTG